MNHLTLGDCSSAGTDGSEGFRDLYLESDSAIIQLKSVRSLTRYLQRTSGDFSHEAHNVPENSDVNVFCQDLEFAQMDKYIVCNVLRRLILASLLSGIS
jgi:hypothetical protein